MHPISFLQKRAHLCAVARGREMFAHIEDMTPARFDIFYLIYNHFKVRGFQPTSGYQMEETALTEQLGLARQTVWEAVKRLVQLGLLERKKEHCSGRLRNIVEMTAEGVRRFRLALNAAFSERKPLPLAAPAENPPRFWRRPELADPTTPADAAATETGLLINPNEVVGAARKIEPTVLGREVERIYTSFAWKMVRRGGRRGRRVRHLEKLDCLISFMAWIAEALGNTADCIYPFKYSIESEH